MSNEVGIIVKPATSRVAQHLVLPKATLRRLEEVGVHCRCEVRLEYQPVAKRHVVHGTESGGAVRELGRYVTFAGLEGEPIAHLHPIDSLKSNGAHAVVVAPMLVMVDMFRFGRTCQLLIVKHEPLVEVPGKRPELKSTVLFRGVDGYLGLEPEGKGREGMGPTLPEFYSRSGEKNEIPKQFRAVVQAATLAVSCIDCRHSHFLLAC
jgi:hypothetical protein